MVERAARADIIADIGNRNDGLKAAGRLVRRRPDRIIEVTRIAWIDGNNRQMAQVFSGVGGDWQVGNAFGLTLHCFGHLERNAVFVDGNQAETFWCKRIAQNLSHLGRLAHGVAGQFGEHQIARLRLANFADLRVKA